MVIACEEPQEMVLGQEAICVGFLCCGTQPAFQALKGDQVVEDRGRRGDRRRDTASGQPMRLNLLTCPAGRCGPGKKGAEFPAVLMAVCTSTTTEEIFWCFLTRGDL